MTPAEILNEIRIRIESKFDDEKSMVDAGDYLSAQRLKDQREELENLLSVLTEEE